MARRSYPHTENRRWLCPSCKAKVRGRVCNLCRVKREDAERLAVTKERTNA